MNTKALRQKILDLAIHGKLVPQDPNDEPASVLLERIKAEKERLIKEGKIKRTKRSKAACDKPHYENEAPQMEPHSHNGAYHKSFLQIRLFSLTLSPIVLQKQTSKIMGDFNYLHITGVNNLPGYHAAAAFTTKSSEVFKEAEEIFPC